MKDDNKKLYPYNDGRCYRMQYMPGSEQIAIANAEGFAWIGSTQTHDIYHNPVYRVRRYINKETKRFCETRDSQFVQS